jgi:hypothetical protein
MLDIRFKIFGSSPKKLQMTVIYLKDRRPGLYKKLVSERVDFIDTTGHPINPDTDFSDGGFEYQVYKDGKEIPRKDQ